MLLKTSWFRRVRAGADFSELDRELKSASKKLKAAGKELTDIGKSMTMGLTAPIIGAGAAAFQMAANMSDAMGATQQIFGDSADSMTDWAKSLSSSYGIASGEALEYGNMMGAMLQNIGGLTEDQAASQAQTLIKLAGDLTAMYGGTTQDAVQALTGALKGNNAMLDNYGMAVNEATIKMKAMEMGLITEGQQMTLAAKQAATLALITEQSAAASGQASREADGASGSMRAMTTELKNLGASFGEILLPAITALVTKLNELTQWFGQLDQTTKENIVTALALVATIGPVLLILGKLAAMIASGVAIYGSFVKAIAAGNTVLAALGIAIGPAGLIMIGLTALAAAAYLIITNWESIKTFFSGLGDHIANVFTNTKNFVLGIWDGMTTGIKNSINAIIGHMNKLIAGLNKIRFTIPSKIPGIGGISWGFNLPSIPALAEGGIVTQPTLALIGEAGPEAVVPLSKGNMNGSNSIVLNIYGSVGVDDIGEQLVNTLRRKGVMAFG